MDNNYTQIKDLRPGLKNVNTVFIVLEIGHPTLTKENREVRTFKVADASACINASIWDEAGQLLAPGDIVKLTKGYASIWRNCLTLYTSKMGEIHKIGEFCMVFNEQLNMSDPNQMLTMAPSSANQSNTVPLNNGTNNGAGRITPSPSTNSLVHNNAASNVKSSNTSSRFSNSSEQSKSHKHNRRGNGSRERRREERREKFS